MRMRLRDLREDNDLTQQQVAQLLGTSFQYYQKYESGVRQITVERLEILADFYHTSTDYILGRTNIRKPYPKQWTNALKQVIEIIHFRLQKRAASAWKRRTQPKWKFLLWSVETYAIIAAERPGSQSGVQRSRDTVGGLLSSFFLFLGTYPVSTGGKGGIRWWQLEICFPYSLF